MILGHEVSHLIEGHFSVSSYVESWIRGAEILVLMLDPTEGLLSLGKNDSFKLISVELLLHFQHFTDKKTFNIIFRLILIDIFVGIASFLSSSREALVAAFSRTHETEADELGCRLAAMSCYDTRRGIEVFRKMQEAAEFDGTASKQNLMSSHPPSQERYDNLQMLVETQNFSEYSYCNTLQKRITRAFKSKDF